MWPRTTSFLEKWGLLAELAASGCPAIDRVTADYGPIAVSGRPSPVEGTGIMYCPRRTILDMMLVEAARVSGERGGHVSPNHLIRSQSRPTC